MIDVIKVVNDSDVTVSTTETTKGVPDLDTVSLTLEGTVSRPFTLSILTADSVSNLFFIDMEMLPANQIILYFTSTHSLFTEDFKVITVESELKFTAVLMFHVMFEHKEAHLLFYFPKTVESFHKLSCLYLNCLHMYYHCCKHHSK